MIVLLLFLILFAILMPGLVRFLFVIVGLCIIIFLWAGLAVHAWEWIPCSSRMADCEMATTQSYDTRVLGERGFYKPATNELITCTQGDEQCPPK